MLPDFEQTFFASVDCRNRSAIYVSAQTKRRVSAILHLLGNDNTRLTALVDNILRFVMDIYRDELNYLHEREEQQTTVLNEKENDESFKRHRKKMYEKMGIDIEEKRKQGMKLR